MAVMLTRDERIVRAIRTEMDLSPQLSGGRLLIDVAGGVVTITGHVRDRSEQAAARRAVQRIRGVSDVTDETVVDTERIVAVDKDIARAADLIVGSMSDSSGLQVSCRDRDITVRGWVPVGFDRPALIRALGDIARARTVSHDIEISVTPADRGDRSIQSKVMRELGQSSSIPLGHVGVSVEAGIVTLSGTVRTADERDAACACAFRVAGVQSIADEIRTEREAFPLSDQALASEVRAVLQGNSRVRGLGIYAEITSGVVILRGTVVHRTDRDLVGRVISGLSHVRRVDNRIALLDVTPQSALVPQTDAAEQVEAMNVDTSRNLSTAVGPT